MVFKEVYSILYDCKYLVKTSFYEHLRFGEQIPFGQIFYSILNQFHFSVICYLFYWCTEWNFNKKGVRQVLWLNEQKEDRTREGQGKVMATPAAAFMWFTAPSPASSLRSSRISVMKNSWSRDPRPSWALPPLFVTPTWHQHMHPDASNLLSRQCPLLVQLLLVMQPSIGLLCSGSCIGAITLKPSFEKH